MIGKFSYVWGNLSNKVGTSTIRKCSYGGPVGSKTYLVESEKIVINFDDASEALAEQLQVKKPDSVDALYIQDERLYLVEFKNTDDPNYEQVKMKIHDTLAILMRFDYITYSDLPFINIILVRKFKSKEKRNMHHIKKAGKVPRLKLKLNFIQKVYQTNVFDISPEEYKKLIIPNI